MKTKVAPFPTESVKGCAFEEWATEAQLRRLHARLRNSNFAKTNRVTQSPWSDGGTLERSGDFWTPYNCQSISSDIRIDLNEFQADPLGPSLIVLTDESELNHCKLKKCMEGLASYFFILLIANLVNITHYFREQLEKTLGKSYFYRLTFLASQQTQFFENALVQFSRHQKQRRSV